MRLLCVGRHAFLSEHLCRLFGEHGADCAGAVGPVEAVRVAASHEPHVVVCDCDLLTPALLDEWAAEPAFADVPLVAVTLTRRAEDVPPVETLGVAGVIYLPALDATQMRALLAGAYRTRGVMPPVSWQPIAAPQSISTH